MLLFSPNFIVCTFHLVIKSRRLRWVSHVAKMEEGRSAFKMLTGKLVNLQARGLQEGLEGDGRTILHV
jgi:hypothetical protein